MSLLNEALRKRNKELGQNSTTNMWRKQPKVSRKGRKKTYVVLTLLFFTSIAISGIWLVYSSSNPSLKKQKPIKKNITTVKGGIEPDQRGRLSEPNVEEESASNKELTAKRVIASRIDQAAPKKGKGVSEDRGTPKSYRRSGTRPSKKRSSKIKKRASKMKQAQSRNVPKRGFAEQAERLFYDKALSYHRRNELQKAIEMYVEVLKKDPEHYDALFNLASIYLKTSAFSEAYPLLQRLMNHNPEDPQILVNMAVAEIGLGRPQKALSYLKRAESLKDAPQFEIYLHRGVALSRLKKSDEAMIFYKKAEKLHANDHCLLFNMAMACDKLERYREALTYYGRLLKQGGPSSPNERKEVEARVRILKAYIVRNQKTP